MDFVTLGMFIIDEIHYQPPKQPDLNVMGGAGLYAALGARLFRSPPLSSKVGWVVHQGHDFPSHIKETIDSWNTNCHFVQTPDRQTTRAWNRYEPTGYRSFKYLNDKVRVDEHYLTAEQLTSKIYHFICSADRCIDLVRGIRDKRKKIAEANNTDDHSAKAMIDPPVFIWEPFPALCKPSELRGFLKATKSVDIVSPNLDEFCSLLDIGIDLAQPCGWASLRQKCREIIEFVSENSEVALVVRLGEKGCCVAQPDRYLRLPAYHEQDAASRVTDPTGGGNTFLGGFGIGILQSSEPSRAACFEQAACYGAVAASFAIEQVGTPILDRSPSQGELWNGVKVESRLEEYRQRVAKYNDHAWGS
ncbi:MAG: hypothetical protein Q9225_003447 [Loekoesia sp. 1 TL-2023]